MEYYKAMKNEICRGFGMTWGKCLRQRSREKQTIHLVTMMGAKRNHILDNPSLTVTYILTLTTHAHSQAHKHPIISTVFLHNYNFFLFLVFKNLYTSLKF